MNRPIRSRADDIRSAGTARAFRQELNPAGASQCAAPSFLAQFKSPIILILIGAAIVSLFLQARTDVTLIITIIVASGLLGFWKEYGPSGL